MKCVSTLAILVAGAGLSACAQQRMYDSLPTGEPAYAIVPPESRTAPPDSVPIAPGDQIAVTVFGEPDLSLDKVPVDAAGLVQMPLIGAVKVGGTTPAEASRAISARLGSRYLRHPDVAVNVVQGALRSVAVEGQVARAGQYAVAGDTTLLGAIALAGSPTRIAKLDEIVVFRTQQGERMAARFNLERIRAGLDPDPVIRDGDVVVVGFSQAKAIYRDVLQLSPLFNIFTRF